MWILTTLSAHHWALTNLEALMVLEFLLIPNRGASIFNVCAMDPVLNIVYEFCYLIVYDNLAT